MHEPLKGRLEEYLEGISRYSDVDAHLENCRSCREELAAMKSQTDLFRSLSTGRDGEPAPGFYARVLNRIETQQRPSIWSLFGDSVFAKRLALSAMAFFVLLGTLLVSTHATEDQVAISAPEVIMASEEQPVQQVGEDPQRDREAILVNLASYSD